MRFCLFAVSCILMPFLKTDKRPYHHWKLLSQTNSSMTDLSMSYIRHLTYYISYVPTVAKTSSYRTARLLSKMFSSHLLIQILPLLLMLEVGDELLDGPYYIFFGEITLEKVFQFIEEGIDLIHGPA